MKSLIKLDSHTICTSHFSQCTRAVRLSVAGIGILLVGLPSAQAATLTGSGTHLVVPSTPPPPFETRTVTPPVPPPSGFTGSWTSAVQPPWASGSFIATGPVPAGATSGGTTDYDFTTFGVGILPIGTFFNISDLDGGSGSGETITLRAWDASGSLSTVPWLNEPIGGGGISASGGPFLPTDTPGWAFNSGEYFFDGGTVTGGNPSMFFTMENNINLAKLEVIRSAPFANFRLAAPLPVPEPSSFVLMLMGCFLVGRRRRRV